MGRCSLCVLVMGSPLEGEEEVVSESEHPGRRARRSRAVERCFRSAIYSVLVV